MHSFIFIALQICSVFLAVAIGYIARRWRKEKIDLDTISELIIYVGSPALIITKLATAKYEIAELGTLAGAMLFIIAGSFILSQLFLRNLNKEDKTIASIATSFMNTANMGFPITLFTLGAVAFQKAIILDLTMIICLFSVGIGLISKKYYEWLKLPIIPAAIIGLFFSFSHISMPNLIFKPLAMIGELAVPLMMISLGCKLADIKKVDQLSTPLAATLIRSVGGFLVGWLFVYLFKISGITKDVILLYAALPAPVMSYVLAQKYHKNEKLAAEIVFLSNLSAIVLLPIIIFLIKFVC